MPKFYDQWRKFLNGTLNEVDLGQGKIIGGKWPKDHPMGRAQDLAHKGMETAASTGPGEKSAPWEKSDECGAGFTDASLNEADYGVLDWILSDLRTGVGRGNMAERFINVMEKLGVALGDPETRSHDSGAPDIDADDMEDALGGFQDEMGRQAWAHKQKGPRGV